MGKLENSAMIQSVSELISLSLAFLLIFRTISFALADDGTDEASPTEYRYELATSPDAAFVYENTHYFEIIFPESLSYTYKLRRAKDFGNDFDREYKKIRMVIAEPIEACSPIINNVERAVAFILRGGCSFLTKSRQVEKAGAVAVIVADNDEENDEYMIDMVDDSTGRSVEIPSLFLMGKDGMMIRRNLMLEGLDEAIINIPVNLTGIPIGAAKQPPWTLW
ncbi:hypothetical protein C0Q70_16934 [Pomacea canaliculata]|uniref:PA domain-containing protein n=1 Tax=Pomacea canaliculata TaxID=400727 RepID=A0A2T7NR63_POMCA|nr:protease-associated domain-containing protein 1-like [Pomacea canaliculata]PVD23661.1 hypothetical protein C0Q70_16934 [Pomacea canaliculata]